MIKMRKRLSRKMSSLALVSTMLLLGSSSLAENDSDYGIAALISGHSKHPTPMVHPQEKPTSKNNRSTGLQRTGLSDQAFANTVRSMAPLTPTQIKTLRKIFDDSQRAAAAYPGTPPKPTSSSVIVNLSPNASPPIVRLRSGFVSSLVFVDSTGAPWPIKAYDIGDPRSFNVQWDKEGNTLMVQALDRYKNGNLAIMLQGLNTPVMVTLMPGQNAVDYRVDFRVPGFGPNAKPNINGLPATESPQLLNILNGIPPQGSKVLNINGGGCQGWFYSGHLYLRTRMTLLSPAWVSTMTSGDGTHAYELQPTPVILALQHGQLITLKIKGL